MKKIVSILLAVFMVAGMLSSMAVNAQENGIVFYDAGDDSVIQALIEEESVYAKVAVSDAETVSLIAAHYEKESEKLAKVEFIETKTVIDGVAQTSTISVTDTQVLKVFAWAGTDTLVPVLLTPGSIERAEKSEKFRKVFQNTQDYLYRIGNKNTVTLDKLFAPIDGTEIGNVTVSAEAVDGTGVTVAISEGTDWTKRTVSFTGTGIVKMVITDDDRITKPTELYLEVVDAYNVTAASNATDRDIVLLNNVGLSQQVVSGGHTIYGNGFSMTATSDQAALDRGYAFMTVNNGNLDNVRIIAPNFPYPILYETNKKDDPTEPQIDGTKTRYYNIRSAVMVTGDCTISNSYISGGRAALYVTAGDTVLDNTTVYGGAAANIHLNSANSLTMRDVTLIQEPIQATVHDTTKTLMGISLFTVADSEGNATPITLEGKLIQYAWANEEYKVYVPAEAQSMVNHVLSQEEYIHPITYKDGVTRDSLNLGFIYMVEDMGANLNDPVIYDNRVNKDSVPYQNLDLTSVKVYSYTNANGTDPEVATYPTYESTANGNILATAVYSETDENKVLTHEYINETGWINRFTVNLDKGAYSFDFSKLTLQKYGKDLAYTVTKDGEAVDTTQTIPVTVGTHMYELNVTDNIFYDENGEAIDKTVTYTYPFYLSGTESDKNAPVLAASNWEAGLCVATSKGGTWHGAAPALEGLEITYWSVAESQYKTIQLSDYTPTTLGKQNGTDTVWTYTPENEDFTLTLTGGQVHSSKKVYAMPVVVNNNGTNKLYFVASSSSGLVNSGNTARNVPVSYEFTDKNGKSLSFSHTWSVAEDQNNEYNYTKFCDGTLEAAGSSSCFIEDTLITMGDGSVKAIKDITLDDKVLSYNFFTGSYEEKDVALLVAHGVDTYPVANLTFSDGTTLRIIGDHGVFDYDRNEYVYLTVDNMDNYLGHTFVKEGEDGNYELVTLEEAVCTVETVGAYSITSAGNANAFAQGMLTVAPPDTFYNWIEMGDKLRYDTDAFQKDIETYGLYTYEDFEGLVTYEQFIDFNGAYLKIPVEKGIFTWDYIVELIGLYVNP